MRTPMLVLVLSLATVGAGTVAGQPLTSPAVSGPVALASLLSALARVARPPVPVATPTSVEALVDEALVRNPRLIVLRREYEAMRHRPSQALALDPPSFEAQIWQWPLNTLSARDANMFMFTVSQAFPGRGKRGLRAALAEKDAELSLAAVAVEARDVVDAVQRAYADLYLAQREIEIHHDNVALLRQLADASEARYVTARTSQQDLLKAVVALSRLHEHLVTLGERERLAQARLNTLLDRPPDVPIGRVIAPTDDLPLPPVAELQRQARDHQPELRAVRLAIERAEAALAAERQEYQPDFIVKGGYMLMPMPDTPNAWTAMVGLTWPRAPWSRGGIDARVAESRADLETARAQLAAAENAIRFAVHDAHVRAEAAQERAALLRTSILPQSDQTLAVSRVAYQADQGDFLSLLDNQRVLLDARLEYHRALTELAQARADLERAVGADLPPTPTADVTTIAKEVTQP